MPRDMLVFVQCPPRRDIGHAHAGRLAEQRARVPVHQFFKGEIGGLLRRFFQRAADRCTSGFPPGWRMRMRIMPRSWGLTRAPSTADKRLVWQKRRANYPGRRREISLWKTPRPYMRRRLWQSGSSSRVMRWRASGCVVVRQVKLKDESGCLPSAHSSTS